MKIILCDLRRELTEAAGGEASVKAQWFIRTAVAEAAVP